MNNNKNKTILISSCAVYHQDGNKINWFIVKQNDETGWEIPKTPVRRGESSVRAVIRMMGEQGGMRAKVLEEVGRSGGSASINGKIVSQRYIYYLLVQRGDTQVLGFVEYEWMDYAKAIKKLKSKKDQSMLAKAREVMKEVQKDKKRQSLLEEEEDELFLEEIKN